MCTILTAKSVAAETTVNVFASCTNWPPAVSVSVSVSVSGSVSGCAPGSGPSSGPRSAPASAPVAPYPDPARLLWGSGAHARVQQSELSHRQRRSHSGVFAASLFLRHRPGHRPVVAPPRSSGDVDCTRSQLCKSQTHQAPTPRTRSQAAAHNRNIRKKTVRPYHPRTA